MYFQGINGFEWHCKGIWRIYFEIVREELLTTYFRSSAICSIECREDRDCGRGKECIQDGCRRICSPLMSVGESWLSPPCSVLEELSAWHDLIWHNCVVIQRNKPECWGVNDNHCIWSHLSSAASLHLPRPYISHPGTDDRSDLERDESWGGQKQVSPAAGPTVRILLVVVMWLLVEMLFFCQRFWCSFQGCLRLLILSLWGSKSHTETFFRD